MGVGVNVGVGLAAESAGGASVGNSAVGEDGSVGNAGGSVGNAGGSVGGAGGSVGGTGGSSVG